MKITIPALALSTITSILSLALPSTVFAGEQLAKISSNHNVSIGYRESSVPYSYILSDGKPVGYSFDICNEVVHDIEKALKTHLTVSMQAVNGQTRIPLVQNGTIALECGSTTDNAEREKSVSFSIIDADPVTPAVLSDNTTFHKLEDFKGKSVVVVAGTTGEKIFRTLNATENYGTTITTVRDYPEAFLILHQGRADAVVTNNVLLAGEVSKLPNAKDFKVLSSLVVGPFESIGIMFNKDDKELRDIVRNSISRQKADGTLERLYAKWFSQPIAPANASLNLNWTPEQKQIVWGSK